MLFKQTDYVYTEIKMADIIVVGLLVVKRTLSIGRQIGQIPGFVKAQNGKSGIRLWSLLEGVGCLEACQSGFHPSFDSLLLLDLSHISFPLIEKLFGIFTFTLLIWTF